LRFRRLDSLLHDTPDAMIAASDGGGTITAGNLVDLLPAQQRQLLVKNMTRSLGRAAARAVRKLNDKGTAEPANFWQSRGDIRWRRLRSRHRLRRAPVWEQLGDAQSMRDLLDLARSRGWKGGANPEHKDPRNSRRSIAAFAGSAVRGPLFRAFRGSWRSITYLPSPLRECSTSAPRRKPWRARRRWRGRPCCGPPMAMARATPTRRDPTTPQRPRCAALVAAPAACRRADHRMFLMSLCDDAGTPRIVLVRQPTESAPSGQYALRAFRASDGKLLWVQRKTRRTCAGSRSPPAPRSSADTFTRMAGDAGQQSDRLVMIALEY
jgi:hypothetical protein